MQLLDHADGVAGHFCIGRRIGGSNFWEFYNKGSWQSAGQLFTSRETAEFKLQELLKAVCQHEIFEADVTVNRLEDSGRFNADVRIKCTQCGVPFRFIGLPAGLDLNGASVSVDGTEGRFAVAPKGEVITPLEGLGGFTVRREK